MSSLARGPRRYCFVTSRTSRTGIANHHSDTVRYRNTLRYRKARQEGERSQVQADPEWYVRWIEAHGHELPLPVDQFFEVLNGVAKGLLQQRLRLGAEVISDEVITWALTRLVSGDGDSSG